jgi:hypothetical protein
MNAGKVAKNSAHVDPSMQTQEHISYS